MLTVTQLGSYTRYNKQAGKPETRYRHAISGPEDELANYVQLVSTDEYTPQVIDEDGPHAGKLLLISSTSTGLDGSTAELRLNYDGTKYGIILSEAERGIQAAMDRAFDRYADARVAAMMKAAGMTPASTPVPKQVGPEDTDMD